MLQRWFSSLTNLQPYGYVTGYYPHSVQTFLPATDLSIVVQKIRILNIVTIPPCMSNFLPPMLLVGKLSGVIRVPHSTTYIRSGATTNQRDLTRADEELYPRR